MIGYSARDARIDNTHDHDKELKELQIRIHSMSRRSLSRRIHTTSVIIFMESAAT
jgi:hypothetical protein